MCGVFQSAPTTAAAGLSDQYADAPSAAGRRAAAPAAADTQVAADYAATPVPMAAPAATEIAAPQAVVAAAPQPEADSSVTALGEVAISRFSSKAKAFESSALVRDKAMLAVPAIAPAPAKGTSALRDYLRREAAEFELDEGAKPLSGTVRLRFTVEADGKLSNIRVVRGIRADYDEEALRMVCEGPAWRPGIANGRRAALPMEITVSF